MAVGIKASKKGNNRPVLTLVRGDTRTQIVRMIVERYYGGVDLANLVWSVVIENADGATDTVYIPGAEVEDAAITIEWNVAGIATAAVGKTEFELEGIGDDGEYIWQSGKYIINVTEDINHTPGDAEQAQLTAVQKLILYVNNELANVQEVMADVAAATKNANDTAAELRTARENGEFKGEKGDTPGIVYDGELTITIG